MPADNAQRPLDGRVANRHDADRPSVLALDALTELDPWHAVGAEPELELGCHVPDSDCEPLSLPATASALERRRWAPAIALWTDALGRWCKVLNVANKHLGRWLSLSWQRWRHRTNWND